MAADLSHELVFRFTSGRPELIPLLQQAGVRHVVPTPDAALAAACREAGLSLLPADGFDYVGWEEAGRDPGEKTLVLTAGNWPGISRGGQDGPRDETASASHRSW